MIGGITKIFISSKKHGNFVTLIDTKDLPKVIEAINWGVMKRSNADGYYVNSWIVESGCRRKVLLHRLIMGEPKGKVIDHINHDTLDNRGSVNLRICTTGENNQNRSGSIRNNVTGVRGVTWRGDRGVYQAQVGYKGILYHVGTYKDLKEAEREVRKARAKLLKYSS